MTKTDSKELIAELRNIAYEMNRDGWIGGAKRVSQAADALEAAERDAARWRMARVLIDADAIDDARWALDNFGGKVGESDRCKTDAAIDVAIAALPAPPKKED